MIILTGQLVSGRNSLLPVFKPLQKEHVNVVAVEDPVEIYFAWITQAQVMKRLE